MLVNAIRRLFSTYIYTRHKHDWHLDQAHTTRSTVGAIEFSKTVYVMKCDCGKIMIMREPK